MKKTLLPLIAMMLAVSSACGGAPPAATAEPARGEAIGYYYLAMEGEATAPDGNVSILGEQLLLCPTQAEAVMSGDVGADLRQALQALALDRRNQAVIAQVAVASLAFDQGHAEIALEGNLYAAGDVVSMAVRMAILLTVFANPAVDTARITLNGENIANLGESFSGSAKPEAYTYTRGEIEAFMAEHAHPDGE